MYKVKIFLHLTAIYFLAVSCFENKREFKHGVGKINIDIDKNSIPYKDIQENRNGYTPKKFNKKSEIGKRQNIVLKNKINAFLEKRQGESSNSDESSTVYTDSTFSNSKEDTSVSAGSFNLRDDEDDEDDEAVDIEMLENAENEIEINLDSSSEGSSTNLNSSDTEKNESRPTLTSTMTTEVTISVFEQEETSDELAETQEETSDELAETQEETSEELAETQEETSEELAETQEETSDELAETQEETSDEIAETQEETSDELAETQEGTFRKDEESTSSSTESSSQSKSDILGNVAKKFEKRNQYNLSSFLRSKNKDKRVSFNDRNNHRSFLGDMEYQDNYEDVLEARFRSNGVFDRLDVENMDYDNWKEDFEISSESALEDLNYNELRNLKRDADSIMSDSKDLIGNKKKGLMTGKEGKRKKSNKDLIESRLFGSDYDYSDNFGLGVGWDSIFGWRQNSGLFNNQTGFNDRGNSTNFNGTWNNTNSNININQIEIIAERFNLDVDRSKNSLNKIHSEPYSSGYHRSREYDHNYNRNYGYEYGGGYGYDNGYGHNGYSGGLVPYGGNSYGVGHYNGRNYHHSNFYSHHGRKSRSLEEAIEIAQQSLIEESFTSYDINYEIIQKLANMTLRDKINQRLMPVFNLTDIIDITSTVQSTGFSPVSKTSYWDSIISPDLFMLNSTFSAALEQYRFGGIIISNNSTISLNQTVFTISNIKYQNYLNNTIPLFIGEYDKCHIGDSLGFGTEFPSDMAICASCDKRNAFKIGEKIGRENRYLGINFNTDTECNISLNSTNYRVGVDHFSSDPHLVSKFASKKLYGIRESKVVAGVRGFPGVGDAKFRNSTSLPYSRRGVKNYLKVNLLPFIKLINKGVDVIDASGIQMPALDDTLITNDYTQNQTVIPGNLSETVIIKLLRAFLGYKGVVQINAEDYGLLSKVLYPENIVSMAFKSCVDIIQVPVNITDGVADYSIFEKIYQKIGSDILSGNYTVKELNRSVLRILRLKSERNILKNKAPLFEKPIIRANLKMKTSLSQILSEKVQGESVTLLKNDNICGLPFDVNFNSKIAIFMPDQIQCDIAKNETLALGITSNIDTYAYRNLTFSSSWNDAINNATHIIIGTECFRNNVPNDGFTIDINNQDQKYWNNLFPMKVIQQANLNNTCISTLLLNTPYCAANFGWSNSILCGYGRPPCEAGEGDRLSISALIGSVFGYERPRGVLPAPPQFQYFADPQMGHYQQMQFNPYMPYGQPQYMNYMPPMPHQQNQMYQESGKAPMVITKTVVETILEKEVMTETMFELMVETTVSVSTETQVSKDTEFVTSTVLEVIKEENSQYKTEPSGNYGGDYAMENIMTGVYENGGGQNTMYIHEKNPDDLYNSGNITYGNDAHISEEYNQAYTVSDYTSYSGDDGNYNDNNYNFKNENQRHYDYQEQRNDEPIVEYKKNNDGPYVQHKTSDGPYMEYNSVGEHKNNGYETHNVEPVSYAGSVISYA
ncbi:Beta-hexosaminidase [Smittium culicis]|uniref:beta-N-acetylhexosaminidase n=1 Tax=Smittium culicis TaxID=133412 RepID=A0A1R1YG02_9FUNG|nr:Beta-hexosaminidase [Smittium culicis]